jgi:hypothetical protein
LKEAPSGRISSYRVTAASRCWSNQRGDLERESRLIRRSPRFMDAG